MQDAKPATLTRDGHPVALQYSDHLRQCAPCREQVDPQEATIAALKRELAALRNENMALREQTLAGAAAAGAREPSQPLV